jgi:dimethylhistidine N-methyltransferase
VAVHRFPVGEKRLKNTEAIIQFREHARYGPQRANGDDTNGEFRFFDCKPSTTNAREELLAGLLAEQKFVSAKFFYDQRGSELFEEITRLPEYYLTRTEMALLEERQDEIAGAIGQGVCLVEYGSGSSYKVRKLLETVRPKAYVPVDISRDHLQDMARTLHGDFGWLCVYPTSADFTKPFTLPEPVGDMAKVGFFPGSSIGNFDPDAARTFLGNARRTLGAGSRFIVGVDRKKATGTLEAAYNDAAGVTAEFNLNVLNNLGSLLGGRFDPSLFRHRAIYNTELGCIQMFLDVVQAHSVRIAGGSLEFRAGESIHTENSFKYDSGEFTGIARDSGFSVKTEWTDTRQWFSVFLLVSR